MTASSTDDVVTEENEAEIRRNERIVQLEAEIRERDDLFRQSSELLEASQLRNQQLMDVIESKNRCKKRPFKGAPYRSLHSKLQQSKELLADFELHCDSLIRHKGKRRCGCPCRHEFFPPPWPYITGERTARAALDRDIWGISELYYPPYSMPRYYDDSNSSDSSDDDY